MAPPNGSEGSAPTPGAGSAPAPSSSPSTSSSPPTPGGSGGTGAASPSGGPSFDFMGEVFGSPDTSPVREVEPVVPPSVAPEVQPPPPEVQPAQPAQQPAAAPAPTTGPQGTQTTAPQAPSQPSEGQFDPTDPSALSRGLAQYQAEAIEHLAQNVFKLSPEELRSLEEDVAGNVPRLLAKAVVFSQQQFLAQLGNIVPSMLQRQAQQNQVHESNLNKFYSTWPTLDRGKHGELVHELGVRYRKMFPDHTLDQMIQNLGPLVLSAAGLPLQAAATQVQQPRAQGNGQAPPKPQGFVPAAPGATSQAQLVQQNPFEYMGLSS